MRVKVKDKEGGGRLLVEDLFALWGGGGGGVEHATPGEEVLGSIPVVAALSQLLGSLSV